MTSEWLSSIFLFDPNNIWICGGYGTIIKSDNGGIDWIVMPPLTGSALEAIFFAGLTTGWTVGWNGEIYRTSDGGQTWTCQTSGTSEVLYSLYFTDLNHGWIVGSNGNILNTDDGGNTWQINQISNKFLKSVFFFDQYHGWIAGHNGTFFRTTNGGQNWEEELLEDIYMIEDLFFTDIYQGWIVGRGGRILHTNNGGVSDIPNNGWNVSKDRPGYLLFQNFPNPFNSMTHIQYFLPEENYVSLIVYDLTGRVVSRLVDEKKNAGYHSVSLRSELLGSGVYLYKLQTKDFKQTRKLLIIK